jgi:hypothetical protein
MLYQRWERVSGSTIQILPQRERRENVVVGPIAVAAKNPKE